MKIDIQGVFRSKNTIVAYEEHFSGRITELGFDFFHFSSNDIVKHYSSGNIQPVILSHEFWETCVGKLIVDNSNSCKYELFDTMTKRTFHISVKKIDDLSIEITNLTTGEVMECEKVSDL